MTARCCRSIVERALQIDVANSRTRATKTSPRRQQACRMSPISSLLVNYYLAILIYELDVWIERRVGRTRRAHALHAIADRRILLSARMLQCRVLALSMLQQRTCF